MHAPSAFQGGPLVGAELVMMGTTLKVVLLISVPELEATVTWPLCPFRRWLEPARH